MHAPSRLVQKLERERRSSSAEELRARWFTQFRFIVPLCVGLLASQSALLLGSSALHDLLSLARIHQAA